jgi:hypothetical protein
MIEIARHLVSHVHRGGGIDRLDVDLQERHVTNPRLVFDFDRVVAQTDDQIGRAQEAPLDLPATPFDAAKRERVVLVDHALGHRGRCKWQVMSLDDLAEQIRIGKPHGGRADDGNRALRGGEQLARACNCVVGGWA